jgi:hypothetical protein
MAEIQTWAERQRANRWRSRIKRLAIESDLEAVLVIADRPPID